MFANELKRCRPRPGDKWHLDEVFIRIQGKQNYLWRAVDQHGQVLDIVVQSRRSACAAKRFFHKLLRGLQYVARGMHRIYSDSPSGVVHNLSNSGHPGMLARVPT